MHSTSQTISGTKVPSIIMGAKQDTTTIEITLGGQSVPFRVTPDEERNVRNAAQFVEKRANDYRRLIEIYGERTGLSMMALEILLDKLRLERANDDSSLAIKVDEVVSKISEALGE